MFSHLFHSKTAPKCIECRNIFSVIMYYTIRKHVTDSKIAFFTVFNKAAKKAIKRLARRRVRKMWEKSGTKNFVYCTVKISLLPLFPNIFLNKSTSVFSTTYALWKNFCQKSANIFQFLPKTKDSWPCLSTISMNHNYELPPKERIRLLLLLRYVPELLKQVAH